MDLTHSLPKTDIVMQRFENLWLDARNGIEYTITHRIDVKTVLMHCIRSSLGKTPH
jgi:hypothetical protein